MAKRICIITQTHLCRNPRVVKEALLLIRNGYDVRIFYSSYSQKLNREDDAIFAGTGVDLIPITQLERSDWSTLFQRSMKKAGCLLVKYLKIQSPLSLGYAPWRFIQLSRRFNADLYICHQELGLYTGVQLLKKGKKVAFDFEDWYSEDLLPAARSERPLSLLKYLEKEALQRGVFTICPATSMGRQLAETYQVNAPKTVYNTFAPYESALSCPKLFIRPLKLFWFSQTIGPGRGLEPFIRLLDNVRTKVELHLLGNISDHYALELTGLLPDQHQLTFHQLVEEKKLAETIARFDIGLALEQNEPASRNYTITNKFFQYLQSGLPVITSKTAGQEEVFEKFRPGFLLSARPGLADMMALDQWLSDPQMLQQARQQAITAARSYTWEKESKKLLHLVDNVFSS